MTPSGKAEKVCDAIWETIIRIDADTDKWLAIIEAALIEAEAAAYERAAQVAATDALHEIAGERSDWAQGYRAARRSIATAIRALKDKGE